MSDVVDDSFRLVIVGALLVVLLTGTLLLWLALHSRPAIDRHEEGLAALQTAHTAMLDQQSGIRGYLTTGNEVFLEAYANGRKRILQAERDLIPLATDASLTREVLDLYVAEHRWRDNWAETALRVRKSSTLDDAEIERLLVSGKALFDDYRRVQTAVTAKALDRLKRYRDDQNRALIGVMGAAVLVGLLILVTGETRRRGLRRDVLHPIGALVTGLDATREGRFEELISTDGPAELLDIVDGFNTMTRSLAQARVEAQRRETHIQEQALRLGAILRMVREIGGSLNLKYVLDSVVDGVKTVVGAERVVVWLANDSDAALTRTRDSDPDGDRAGEVLQLGVGIVGRAAKYGRSATGAVQDGGTGAGAGAGAGGGGVGSLAVPLIIGGRVVGVLELVLDGPHLSDERLEVLETLSVHAAAAIEAARLHQDTSFASEHDPLTRLANRRRLEADLKLECDRSVRYNRPVALIMLDLDHFKRLNDTFGHTRGDEVLQGVAETITSELRTTDSAYRFGGEELVVLARESDAAAAMTIAERIRTAIERRFSAAEEGGVTASLGIAAIPEHALEPKALVAAADAALYLSKRAGRNTTTISDTPRPDPAIPGWPADSGVLAETAGGRGR